MNAVRIAGYLVPPYAPARERGLPHEGSGPAAAGPRPPASGPARAHPQGRDSAQARVPGRPSAGRLPSVALTTLLRRRAAWGIALARSRAARR
ncbi:hypothetical protein AB4039_26360 [Streptomyces sp. M-16]|uniref:hypothetical protein n=1 Tax=Streptomyces sp. M-16 TaxID=3233040 RepID=UPI00225286EC